MSLSSNAQAVLLLTAHFSKSGGSVKPLTPGEWGRFAAWLKDRALTPDQLMVNRPGDVLEGWSDRRITSDRIEALLGRGAALAIAVEKWLRAGLWVMTRSDKDYPSRLKRRLGWGSPAVLYGGGDRSLLGRGGLAVVGSRDAVEDDLDYARMVGVAAARQGQSIVSGGARGIDEAAMSAALENDGTVVGVLADGLLRACTGSKYRSRLQANNLALVSTVHPQAGFSAGNAMHRNKYIYCLSDAALVVHSGAKGGTWSGARENLEKRWVPLWVKPTRDSSAGNEALVKQGARWACADAGWLSIEDLWCDRGDLASVSASVSKEEDILLARKRAAFEPLAPMEERSPEGCDDGEPKPSPGPASRGSEPSLLIPRPSGDMPVESESVSGAAFSKADRSAPSAASVADVSSLDENLELYDLFLLKMFRASAESAKTPDELADLLDVNKTQVKAWLKRAQAEKRVRSLTGPVRYEGIDVQQTALFKD